MFRKFLIESANQKWFNKFPMPKNVGSFLVAANNLANAQDGSSEIQESIWDDSKGRGFPLNQGATDFIAASPKSSSTMTDAFLWLITDGLYQATKIRKQLASEFDDPQITEDIIYSPAAWKQFPKLLTFLKEKHKQNPYIFEPSSPIEYNITIKDGKKSNNALVSFTLQEVNQFIQEVNQQIERRTKGSLPNLLQEFHFAPKFDSDLTQESKLGFIEWVENGSWADKSFGTAKDGQDWRTRHGISLHNPKKYQQKSELDKGMLHYEFGDGNIVMPMRELENIRHFMSIFPRKIVANTYEDIRTKIEDIKDPSVKQRVQNILSTTFKGSYGKTVTHAGSRGQSNEDKKDSFDQLEEYLGNMFLIKLALDVYAKSNDAIHKDTRLKELPNDNAEVEAAMKTAIQDEYPGIEPIIRKWPDHRFFVKDGIVYFDWNKPKLADAYFQISDQDVAQAFASIKQGVPYLFGSKRTNVPMTADLYNQGKRIVHKFSPAKIVEKFKSMFEPLLKNNPELLDNSIKYVLDNIKAIPDRLEIPAEKVSSKLGKIFNKSRVLNRKELDSLIQDEPYSVIKHDGKYHVIKKNSDPDAPVEFTGQSGLDPDNLLTPEQKEVNAKAGWKVKGGSDALFNAKRATLMKKGRKIDLFRDNLKADWEFYDRQQPEDNILDKENIPILTASNKNKFLSTRTQGVSSRDDTERDLSDIQRKIQEEPEFYGYANYQDFEEEIQQLARKNASRTFSYNSKEKVGYEAAYNWIYEAMLEWMSNVPEFVSRFGDIDDPSYLKKIMAQANQSGIDFEKEYGQLVQARKTNDNSNLSQPMIQLLTSMGREYRSVKAVRGFGKIVSSQSAEGGMSSRGDDGEDQSFDHGSESGKRHVDAREFDGKGNRGYSSVTNSFSDVEASGEDNDANIVSNMGSVTTLRKERNLIDDEKYNQSYRRQSELMNNIRNTDNKELILMIRSLPSDTTNSIILGKLDAIGDKILNALRFQVAQKSDEDSLVNFIKDVCFPLNQVFMKNNNDTNLTYYFSEILGGNTLLEKAEEAYEKEKATFFNQELRPAAQTVKSVPQEPTSPNLSPTEPVTSPAATPTTPPNPPPRGGLGLGKFIKKKNESYSFRTRYLRKLAEATSAVYGGEKDFEGNWEGAVGDLLGVSIKGEVEDRQSNPDGTKGKKNGKSKSKSK